MWAFWAVLIFSCLGVLCPGPEFNLGGLASRRGAVKLRHVTAVALMSSVAPTAAVWLQTAQTLRPQVAAPKLVTNNPTLTTIALEKPFCAFDGSMLKGGSYEVYLYVILDSGMTSTSSVMNNGDKPLHATFQQTKGGQLGPYKAATLNVPSCVSPPKLSDAADAAKAPAVLTQYLIRVGDSSACPYDPDFPEACNPPLSEDTSYRFKYVLVDKAAGVMKDQTPWSNPIKTKKLKPSSSIDTWPGRRSGGMVVITSVLSVLTFVVVAAFVAAAVVAVLESRDTSIAISCISRTTQYADSRTLEMSESDH